MTTAINVTPDLDVTALRGERIQQQGHAPGRVTDLQHCPQPRTGIAPGLVGALVEDPHGDCRGGHTAVHIPYGDAIFVIGQYDSDEF